MAKQQQQLTQEQLEQLQRAQESHEAELIYRQGVITMRDLIAPPSLEIESGYMRLGKKFVKTIYVYGYPRQVFTGWLSPIINLDEVIDISLFIYPVESRVVLENLKRKMGQLEASYTINQEKGRVRDPGLEAAIQDAEELRDKLQVGEERFFRFGLYLTMYADSLDELTTLSRKIEGIFGTSLVYSKPATMQMEQGFNTTTPVATDQLQIYRNMNTGSLSTSFPFTSAELSRNEGILYGLNRHNNGLVLFDRFSLENANMVVFAKSGAGKSFAIKLEALRSLMMGVECIIIDPENEYQTLSEAVGGSYLRLSLASQTRINPFDLPRVYDQDEADNALQANIISLHGLLRLMMGGATVSGGATLYAPLTPTEDADLDLAIINTYARAGITKDPLTHNATPPTMNDLYNTLASMTGSGPSLAARLRQYTTGTFSGIFSEQSNVSLDNPFLVFNIRDLEDELRPVGMYIVLNYIWNKVKADRRKRLLIVDEAWQLMKYDDSAAFMFSLAKRARKYFLGLTTISQDVEDFLSNKMGRAVVSNSSLQLLLKQAPSAVDIVSETFKLTNEERNRLSQFPVGEGLFFAGLNHVIIRILASETEAQLISTNPEALAAARAEQQAADQERQGGAQ
ncbi:MAG: Type secretory pathway VirB4 component-like protein [Candidatus Saccharibacteria bacterium]|nr:Type secretory pathway VirB4 component-like protein [Candidatus Saccharibacteria bacterium]